MGGETIIRTGENGTFSLPAAGRARLFRDLLAAGRAVRADAFTLVSANTMRTRRVVGMVQSGTTRLEILPKTSGDTQGVGDPELALLARLVAEFGSLHRLGLPPGRLAEGGSFAEWLFRSFASATAVAAAGGLPRRYELHSIRSRTIQGKIDFAALVPAEATPSGLVPLQVRPLSFDNLFSRSLMVTCEMVSSVSRSQVTRNLLNHVLAILRGAGVRREIPSRLGRQLDVIGRMRLDPLWQPVRAFVLSFLRQNALDALTVGAVPFFSLLFDLDEIFENLVRNRITSALSADELTLAPKEALPGLLRRSTDDLSVGRCTPDLVFSATRPTTVLPRPLSVMVGDAKWKLLQEGSKHGLSNSDVYQAAYYMRRRDVSRAVLIFPKVGWMGSGPSVWSEDFEILPEGGGHLVLAAIDVPTFADKPGVAFRQAAESSLRDVLRRAAGTTSSNSSADVSGVATFL